MSIHEKRGGREGERERGGREGGSLCEVLHRETVVQILVQLSIFTHTHTHTHSGVVSLRQRWGCSELGVRVQKLSSWQ